MAQEVETTIEALYRRFMSVTRYQAFQIVRALMYGRSATAAIRLDRPPPPRLVSSLRRLLDEDVALARKAEGAASSYSMAFFDNLPTGSGNAVEYIPVHVFNLAVAHELTRFGCKQREAVELVSEFREKLLTAYEESNKSLISLGRHIYRKGRDLDTQLCCTDRDELKTFFVLRRVQTIDDSIVLIDDPDKIVNRLNQSDILHGPAALRDWINRELTGGLFGVFVMELSELAIRITELDNSAPPFKRRRRILKNNSIN